jgi:hypothetical protein
LKNKRAFEEALLKKKQQEISDRQKVRNIFSLNKKKKIFIIKKKI